MKWTIGIPCMKCREVTWVTVDNDNAHKDVTTSVECDFCNHVITIEIT